MNRARLSKHKRQQVKRLLASFYFRRLYELTLEIKAHGKARLDKYENSGQSYIKHYPK
jgi:hypothetical protein